MTKLTLTQTIDAILADADSLDANDIRELLMMLMNDEPLDLHEFAHLDQNARRALIDARDAIAANIANAYERDDLTDLALSFSLCPLHAIDYAICFDDDDAECAAIRIIHPSHDT